MVEVVRPRVGVAQAVVGREKIRRAVVGCVVDHGPCACRKTAVHDQRDGLFLNLPIRTFRAVDIDVASATVAEWTCGALGRVQLCFPLEQRAVSLHNLGNGNLAMVAEAHRLPVFHDDLVSLHQTQSQATPLLHAQVIECTLELGAIRVVHEEFTTFGNLELLEVETQAGRPFCIDAQTPNAQAILLGPAA